MKERASSSTTTRSSPVSPIVVAGMYRSGTSYLASILAASGVAMGTRLVEADANNPRGYFEDQEFLAVNRQLMFSCTEDAAGHRDWGWTETEAWDEGPLAAMMGSARELLAARDNGHRWGWKDPRTTLVLDFWDELVKDAGLAPGYLLVYRSPWDVADAMQRTGADVFLSNPEYGYRIWTFYNRRLLDFRRRHPERTLLIAIEAVLAEPRRFTELLAARFGLDLKHDLPSRLRGAEGLRAHALDDPLIELVAATSPEAYGLHGELQQVADLPMTGLVPERRSPRTRPKPGSPRLSVVIPCRDHGELLVEAVASVNASAPGSELIVVDDGSRQPRTLEVLGRLRQAGYDILDETGVGLAQARNAGIARAQGPYILTLDADDRLRPHFVDAAMALLDAEPGLGVVYGDRHTFGLRSADIAVPDFDLDRMLCGNYVASCAVFRKAAWSSCGGYARELPAWEDWEFWIALADLGWGFRHLPVLSFDHRLRPRSLVSACESEEVSVPIEQFIVRKHERLYLSRFRHLRVAMQDRAAAEAELRTANNLLADERERLYGELGRWENRVRFMEGTRAWRCRGWLLRLLGRGAARRAVAVDAT
ncbi:MAG: glycosyltransferase [Acidobacteria bacterium]|nr:glycosyltransferase [Acidobacteriota bacterium]